ncbi:class I SAM-dependent methyltransferase [Tropicibacter alexandrii]|uniref:class I SAM-dependent methyltransferase n=1 Tax=Tropicibacter alexandrii TaxID=2267683 RepID=UPI000EF538C4|nr:methyltransferase [Tropicibacter alexandrii]
MTDRLTYAMEAGGLSLPDGPIALFDAPGDAGALPGARVISTFRPDFEAWQRRGVPVSETASGPYAAAIVTLGRDRTRNESRIAEAARVAPEGLVVVDGAKTDGIESILKVVKKTVPVLGQVSKAHGKCLWFEADAALQALAKPERTQNAAGFWTAPGVFSADKPDPGSVALAGALPALKGTVGDLGAGWGWLSAQILQQDAIKALHLVEAEKLALDCAQVNITDPRAKFHWADATRWMSPALLDVVVMNPPFHAGRKGDPSLGQAFIAAAARNLAPGGKLYMVANRHLPYEQTLAECFRDHAEIEGTSAFKILTASRPKR